MTTIDIGRRVPAGALARELPIHIENVESVHLETLQLLYMLT
jgi:hypothetical protein